MSNGKAGSPKAPARLPAKYFLGGALLLVLSGAFYWFWPAAREDPRRSVTLGGTEYRLEIASSPEERARGLSGRESLCERCGMLFVFPEADVYPFWMHETHFSLDILWLRDGTIVWIEREAEPNSDRLLRPAEAADTVVEVPAGAAGDRHVGERLEIRAWPE